MIGHHSESDDLDVLRPQPDEQGAKGDSLLLGRQPHRGLVHGIAAPLAQRPMFTRGRGTVIVARGVDAMVVIAEPVSIPPKPRSEGVEHNVEPASMGRLR